MSIMVIFNRVLGYFCFLTFHEVPLKILLMTIFYLMLGLEILVVLLVSGFLIRKVYDLYRNRRQRKR